MHFPLTVTVCFLVGAICEGAICESACYLVQVATTSQHLDTVAPSPFHLFSNICAWFHSSWLCTSILSTGDVHLYRFRCIFLRLSLIPWMFRLVWYLSSSIQGTSCKRGPLLLPNPPFHSTTSK